MAWDMTEGADESTRCHQCGQMFVIDDDGVAHHITEDGAIDYDADADHVAYSLDGNPLTGEQ